ncbi:hypothetical protein OSTOST_09038 [Ostertagia ostertagi]
MLDSPLNIINIRDVPILSLAMRADQVEGTAEESEIRDELHQMLLHFFTSTSFPYKARTQAPFRKRTQAPFRKNAIPLVNQNERNVKHFGKFFEELMLLLRGSVGPKTDPEQQDKCHESLVLHFDQFCFPLREAIPLRLASSKRFHALCLNLSPQLLGTAMKEMERFCATNTVVRQLQDVE